MRFEGDKHPNRNTRFEGDRCPNRNIFIDGCLQWFHLLPVQTWRLWCVCLSLNTYMQVIACFSTLWPAVLLSNSLTFDNLIGEKSISFFIYLLKNEVVHHLPLCIISLYLFLNEFSQCLSVLSVLCNGHYYKESRFQNFLKYCRYSKACPCLCNFKGWGRESPLPFAPSLTKELLVMIPLTQVLRLEPTEAEVALSCK